MCPTIWKASHVEINAEYFSVQKETKRKIIGLQHCSGVDKLHFNERSNYVNNLVVVV